jgi:hypothetical protein
VKTEHADSVMKTGTFMEDSRNYHVRWIGSEIELSPKRRTLDKRQADDNVQICDNYIIIPMLQTLA